MEYRDLGGTGLRVSEIGFGAWAIGGDAWGPVEDAESLAAMERALPPSGTAAEGNEACRQPTKTLFQNELKHH